MLFALCASFPALGQGPPDPPVEPPAAAPAEPIPESGPPPDEAVPLPDAAPGRVAAADEARGWERQPSRIEPEDVVLAVPRAVLFIPRLALETLFLPIRGGLLLNDRYQVVDRVEEVLYWNEAETFGWYPVADLTDQFGAGAGLTVHHSSLLGYRESLKAKARYGGRWTQAYGLSFEADRFNGSRLWLEAAAEYEANPALLFAGIGPSSRPEVETWYAQERWLGALRLGHTFGQVGRRLQLGVTAIANDRSYAESARAGRPDISTAYDTSELAGFVGGARTVEGNGLVVVDFRSSEGLDGVGPYFEAFAGGVPPIGRFRYLHWGAELSHTLNLYRGDRLLTLRAALDAVDGKAGEIPFSELPRLGGSDRLRGWYEGRFRDEKAVLWTAEYRYPVHQAVSGRMFIDGGTVGPDFPDLRPSAQWRYGYGAGLLIGSRRDVAFRLDVAYGDGVRFSLASDVPRTFRKRIHKL